MRLNGPFKMKSPGAVLERPWGFLKGYAWEEEPAGCCRRRRDRKPRCRWQHCSRHPQAGSQSRWRRARPRRWRVRFRPGCSPGCWRARSRCWKQGWRREWKRESKRSYHRRRPPGRRPGRLHAGQTQNFCRKFHVQVLLFKRRFAPWPSNGRLWGTTLRINQNVCKMCRNSIKKQHIAQLFHWTRRMAGVSGFVKKV